MNNSTKNNFNLSTWIFVLLSCAFIVTIGYKSRNKSDLSEVHKENTNNHKILVASKEKINKEELTTEIKEKEYNNDNTQESIEEVLVSNETQVKEEKKNKNDIYVNKIVISKNIDDDKNSDTYRNPIDAFKTISTLDESVIKEINYYPSLFIWSSINTENISLMNEEQKFEPVNLSMTLKCKDQLIEKIEYNVTANTPRWREWMEINLEDIDTNMLNEFWNVEIIDNRDGTVIESRNFKLINNQQMLEQANINENAGIVIDEGAMKNMPEDYKVDE